MTGPLKLSDGSSAAPAISFNSDPSIGFYKSGNFIAATKPITGVLPIGLGPVPWSRMAVPTGWVLCYGQTLSRTAYPDLWAAAQIEITAGNPLYNNGDGSTTFGILDMRGIGAAGYDVMGGAAASRLPGALGVLQGLRTATLAQASLPNVNFNVIQSPHDHPYAGSAPNGTVPIQGGGGGPALTSINPIGTGNAFTTGQTSIGITVNSGGSSTPFPIVQPTIPMNFILYAGA